MPFTLAHPAAVLPLARTPLVPSALVMGSMAPDLPYFVSLQWIGGDYNLTLTHTASSVLWLDPLIALVLLGVFHLVLKHPLVALLPPAAAGRVWPAAERFTWRSIPAVGWIILSVAVGAATHLGWDALADVFGYSWSPKLNLAGTVLGLAVILAWTWRWWQVTPPEPIPAELLLRPWVRTAALGVLAGAALVNGAVGAVRSLLELRSDDEVSSNLDAAEYALRTFVADAGTAAGVVLAIYAIGWYLGRTRAQVPVRG